MPSFTTNLQGQLVYAKTGQLAPKNYFAVGQTVYKTANNSVGRVRVGSFRQAKNLTKTAAKKIERARLTRAKKSYQYGKSSAQSHFQKSIEKAQKRLEKQAGIGAAEAAAEHAGAPADIQKIIGAPKFRPGDPGIEIPYATYREAIDNYRPLSKMGFLSMQEYSQYNFARALPGLIKRGKITEEEAAELWTQYVESTAPGERTQIWNDCEDKYGDLQDYMEGSPI